MKRVQQFIAIILSALLLITTVPLTSLVAFASSLNQPDTFKITLTWNASPRDLDSHLEGENSAGESFHVYYRNKNVYDVDNSLLASLDVDDTSGYGPENTTIFKSIPNKTFRFYIHNYSGESSVNGCGATVALYKNGKLVGRYTPPANSGSGRYWNLFQILNGKVYVVNKIANTSLSESKNLNINASNLTKNDIVITPKIAASEDNDLSYTAANVQMKKSTEDALVDQENGSFRVDGSQMPSTITLYKEDYRNYIIPRAVVASWERVDLSGLKLDANFKPSIFHSAFLKKDKKDGKPYISTVFCQKSTNATALTNAYKELQHESIAINKDDKYNIIISAEGLNGKSCTYYIAQDQQRKISNSTGVFTSVDLFSVLDFQKTTYVYLVTEDNITSELMPINITKTPVTESDKLIDSLKTGKISLLGQNSVTIPSSVPLVGDAEISLDAFNKIPAGFEYNGNSLKISLGANIFNANTELKKNSPEKYKLWVNEYFKDWKESIKAISEVFSKDKNKKAAETFKKKWGLGEKFKNKEKNWDVDFLGYIELERVDGKWVTKEAAISVEGSFSFEYTVQGAIWVIPAYFSLEAGCSLGATGVLSRMIADSSVPFEFDLTLKLAPEVEIGAGIGYKKAISAGLYAEASMPITFEIAKKHLLMKIQGEIGVEAKLFVFDAKKKILDGSLTLLDKYFGTSGNSATKHPGSSFSEGKAEYSVQSRDYLEKTSAWLSGSQKYPTKSALQNSSFSLTNLQTAIYDNAMPKVVAFGDNMLMTWIEDSVERDAYNRMRLMYSVYDGTVWSNPQPVCDDGLNDNAPVIVSDGTDVYFAWQKLSRTLTESDLESIDDITNFVEIYSAKYDAESKTICNVRRETENNNYDYLQYIHIADGNAELFYVTNNNSATFNDNTIYRSDLAGNTVSVLEDLSYVVDIAVSEGTAGEQNVTYLLDVDGVTTTTDDINVFTYNTVSQNTVDETAKILEAKTESSQVFVKDIFYADFCGKPTLFAVSGKEVFSINSDGIESLYVPDTTISGDVNYVVKNGVPMLYWTSSAECGNAVLGASYENGAWSEPIVISDTKTLLTGVTVVNCNEGVKGVCTSTELVYDEDNATYTVGQTNLCAFNISEKYDVEIDSIRIEEENIRIGEPTTFSVYVKNNGSSFVENLVFNVSDELGYSQSTQLEANLYSGEAKVFELVYEAPENYTKTKLTVTVDSGAAEANTDNNTASQDIGMPKLVISDATVYTTGMSYIVSAFVTNESEVSAENVQIASMLAENVVHSFSTLEHISPRESYYVDFEILSSEIPFEENLAKVFLTSEGENVLGNTVSVLIEYTETECLHPVVYEVVDEPTCGQDGKSTITCAGCQNIVEETVLPALGHNFSESNICSVCSIERINLEETKTVTLSAQNDTVSFVFIPEEDTEYCIFSDSASAFSLKSIYEKTETVATECTKQENAVLRLVHPFGPGVSHILQLTNTSDTEVTVSITIASFVEPTGLTMSKDTLSDYRGTTHQLEAFLSPINAADTILEWSSSDPDVVEVYGSDNFGSLTLKAPGTATITAAHTNGLTATCEVTVLDYPTINAGEQKTVEITASRTNSYFYFTPEENGLYAFYSISDSDTVGCLLNSSGSTIASDDDGGEGGNFRIELELQGGQTYTLRSKFYTGGRTGTFDVKAVKIVDATAIQITDGETFSGQLGSEHQLAAELLPDGARTESISWASTDSSVVSVDSTGYIRLIKAGTAVITATSQSGLTDSIAVEVIGYPAIALDQEVVVSTDENSGTAIFSFVPTVTGTYAFYSYNNDFDTYGYLLDASMQTITSNDDSGGSGNFRIEYFMTAGTTYHLQAKPLSSSSSGTYYITINKLPSATSIEITNGDSITGFQGRSDYLTAVFEPENAITESISWESSDTSVATVTSGGRVDFVAAGTATITVTSENGLTDSVEVIVKAPTVIALDETKTSCTADIFQFTPDEAGMYKVTVNSPNHCYLNLRDSDGDLLVGKSGYDMTVNQTMTAGVTYTLEVILADPTLSDNFTIKVEMLAIPSIVCDEEKILTTDTDSGIGLYKFVPEVDGTYVFYSYNNDFDTYGYLLNASMQTITSNDDSGGSGNFRIEYFMTAGTTYHLQAKPLSSSSSGTYHITINQLFPATSIEITNGDSITGFQGRSDYLTAVFEPENAITESISWESSDTSVATVTSGGRVDFVAAGTATITVTSENGLTDSVEVIVKAPTVIALDETKTSCTADIFQFTPDEDGMYKVTVNSPNHCYLNLRDSDGDLLVGKSGYDMTVNQTMTAGVTYTLEVILADPTLSDNFTIKVEKSAIPSIVCDEEKMLTTDTDSGIGLYKFVPEVDGTYVFYSYNNDFDTYGYLLDASMQVITSNDDGGNDYNFRIEYAMTAGTTYYLKASPYSYENDGAGTYFVKVIVAPRATSMTIGNGDVLSTYVGLEEYLWVDFAPSNCSIEDVVWESDNTSVVTVDEDGTLLGIGIGSATVTATSENGLTDSIVVEVNTPQVIYCGEEKILSSQNGSAYACFSFVPEVDGTYEFCSYGNALDTLGFLFDENMDELDQDDDSGEDCNFKIVYSLTAGTQYYLRSKPYFRNETGSYRVQVRHLVPATLTIGEQVTEYESVWGALDHWQAGAVITLMGDVAGNLEVSDTIVLDLNGYDILGDVSAAPGENIYVLDSQTNDYTINDEYGYGTIAGSSCVIPADGYVQIAESGKASFHKVAATLESVTVRVNRAGIYYTGAYLYDEMAAQYVDTHGVVLSVVNQHPVADGSDSTCCYTSTTAASTLLTNIMSESNSDARNSENAQMDVYGRAYLKLTNGEIVYSDIATVNLKMLVEIIDERQWDTLSEQQKEALSELYTTYSTVMDSWNIPNLKGYIAA